jgi:hypothetical protein
LRLLHLEPVHGDSERDRRLLRRNQFYNPRPSSNRSRKRPTYY